jgi:hypothetical protein
MSDLDDVLAQVVNLGPDTPRAVELGDAVRQHAAARPAASRAAPDPGVLDALRQMSSAVIRPGDTILVGTAPTQITHKQAHELREQLLEKLPGVNVVVLGNVTIEGVYRGGET